MKMLAKEKETKKQRKESVKLDVKNIQQLPEYRSGCEITSTTIVLNYFLTCHSLNIFINWASINVFGKRLQN